MIFSALARIARRQVLVLAHRSELLEQAREKIGRALGVSTGASKALVCRARQGVAASVRRRAA